MSELTGIAWCRHTFNAWWGCAKVSPACDFCYAERDANRYGFDVWGSTAPRRFFGDAHWKEPLRWDRQAREAGEQRLVFLNSMSDFLELREDLNPWRARTADLIRNTPNLTWLMLTKRPQNAAELLPVAWWRGEWPRNCWFGFTAESQEWYWNRIYAAQRVPAPVLFVSVEPLLGELSLVDRDVQRVPEWVIVGGESGARDGAHGGVGDPRRMARRFDFQWARALRDETHRAGSAFFMKQAGTNAYDAGALVELPGKGDDPALWPADLRIRELPRVAAAAEATPA